MFTLDQISRTETARQMRRICAGRWIFAVDDVDRFVNEWLRPFAEMHARNRIEGYVLDLTKGRLLAALDFSGVSQEVYDDIALLIPEPDDEKAAQAFVRLVRNCNPATAPNQVALGFDEYQWPQLAITCARFAGEPQKAAFAAALARLRVASPQVRREVVMALSAPGDKLALIVLEKLARHDADWQVREAVVISLTTIGGEKAKGVLSYIGIHDLHPTPRERAIEGLSDLTLGSRREGTSRAKRVRGAVRTRGAALLQKISSEAKKILALFDDVRSQTEQT